MCIRDRYLGVDIVQALVAQNMRLLSHRKGHFFSVANIATDQLPSVDAVFCRNVLNFLPTEAALKALKNMIASGSRWLIVTTEHTDINHDGPAGVHRPLDLTRPPFCLPMPDKVICLLYTSRCV